MSEQNTAEFNLDSLLEGTLDDLADMPEFRPFPVGTYQGHISIAQDPKLKNIFYAQLKVTETVELADPSETPVEPGAEARIRYDVANQYGQANFKKILAAFGTKLGLGKVSEILEEAKQPTEAAFVTKHNLNKKNGQVYTDIVEVQLV